LHVRSHTVIAHCYSSKTARSFRPCYQPTQWKRYGSWPTAFMNVAALYTSGKEIQLGVVWNVRVAPSCLGGTGALKNTHVLMCWQLCFLLFLDTNEAIPAPTSRTAIRTTTLYSPTHFYSVKRPIPRVLHQKNTLAIQ